MASFTPLDQVDEDKLHATRLLSVEEKPYKRLTKRLLHPDSPIQLWTNRLPTPPAEDGSETNSPSAQKQAQFQQSLTRFRTDITLDFAAFNASIARIQFLRAANLQERERYADEKVKIEATAQAVRDNTANLRVQLEEAQRTLAVRKTYDVLADRITSNAALKPRDELHGDIEKLKAEIDDLKRERVELEGLWVERREGLQRVVREAMRLRSLVRDEGEKDDEKGEDGDGDGDANGEGDEDDGMLDVTRDGRREGGTASNMGTPRPVDDVLTPLPMGGDSGDMTPRSILRDIGVGTPRPAEREEDTEMAEGEIRVNVVGVEKKDQMDTT